MIRRKTTCTVTLGNASTNIKKLMSSHTLDVVSRDPLKLLNHSKQYLSDHTL
jgi:hypothetical protein